MHPPTALPPPESGASGGGGDGVVTPIASVADFLSAMAASAAGGRVAVVGFYAPYCRACGAVRPRVAKEAAARSGSLAAGAAAGGRGVDFFSVDVVAVRELAVRLGVRAMPAFHFYDGGRGKVEDFTVGPRSMGRLVNKLDQLDRVMG